MPDELTSYSDLYAAFAQELYDGCIITDPWIEGRERFRLEPVVLSSLLYTELCSAAETIGKLYQELCQIVWERPELLDEYFHLTPFQKLMWLSSGGQWHGIARLDLFVLHDGTIRCCEMNSDTPSGQAETVIINRIIHSDHSRLIDPNMEFEESYCRMVTAFRESLVGGESNGEPTIGIVYPTEMTEDLSMVNLYRQWFESRGWRVVTGSPFNLGRDMSDRMMLFNTPIDVMLRHYKTDWWSERIPAWSDGDEFNDPDPLDRQLLDVIESESAGRVAVINPFGSVLTQNKLTMAFFWTHQELFSPSSQNIIRLYFPETYRLCDVQAADLAKAEWTVKSDYGCEGDEVILGPHVSDEIWQESLEKAIPDRWIAQRYFDAAPIDSEGIPNYGVFLIGGQASGIFTRLSAHATDYTAVTAPTFIRMD